MKLIVGFCYTALIVTVSVSCKPVEDIVEDAQLQTSNKLISKRDTAVLIDNFPMESSVTDDVHVKRVTRTRPRRKPKRKPPPSQLYPPRPHMKRYKPGHKGIYPKKAPGRYQNYHTLPGKIQYRKPIRIQNKPKRKNRYPKPYETIKEPSGFGEPPAQPLGYQPVKHEEPEFAAEPPTDSYGAPLKTSSFNDNYHTIRGHNYDNTPQHNNFAPSINLDQFEFMRSPDSSYAATKKRPSYHKEKERDNDPIMFEEEPGLDSYADVYKVSHELNNNIKTLKHGKKHTFSHSPKNTHRWRSHENYSEKEHVLVGGQYAEPPGRYIPKQQSNRQYIEQENYFGADDTFAGSSNISPYVNYKNGNIAFSPQNLNDAFGIVDK